MFIDSFDRNMQSINLIRKFVHSLLFVYCSNTKIYKYEILMIVSLPPTPSCSFPLCRNQATEWRLTVCRVEYTVSDRYFSVCMCWSISTFKTRSNISLMKLFRSWLCHPLCVCVCVCACACAFGINIKYFNMQQRATTATAVAAFYE